MSKLIMLSSMAPFAEDNTSEIMGKLPQLTGKDMPTIAMLIYGDTFTGMLNSFLMNEFYFKYAGIGTLVPPWKKGFDPFTADAIYLPGGNTFEAQQFLKEKGHFERLREYAKDHVLIGTSAGSIMMCNTIQIAQFADENEMDSRDMEGLGLTNFEMKPHWDSWNTKMGVFRDYVTLHKSTLYGVPEGEYIFVDGDKVETSFGVIKVNDYM